MALVGLVRVTTKQQEVQRQHDALDPICDRVFEENVSGTLKVEKRPGLQQVLNDMRDDDVLVVHEVDRLGRNLPEGLVVLRELFDRGVTVKVLEGIAAGEHKETSLLLDIGMALAEDHHWGIKQKTRNGLGAARRREKIRGRPKVIDESKMAAITDRYEKDESLREIARAVGVSPTSVFNALNGLGAYAVDKETDDGQ